MTKKLPIVIQNILNPMQREKMKTHSDFVISSGNIKIKNVEIMSFSDREYMYILNKMVMEGGSDGEKRRTDER